MTCPACASSHLDDQGALPAFKLGIFGGIVQAAKIVPGSLMHCRRCGLWFRYPVPNDTELAALYEDLPDTVWKATEPRPYWPLALRLLEAHAINQKVLDVGCFGGELLDWLPEAWSKHGVEPSKAARIVAAKRGINLVGHTARDLADTGATFGAVLAFDVLEHVSQPVDFLAHLKSVVAPGGSLILLTGATDSLSYRLFGRHYWYGSLPEHVTFYSRAWFGWAAKHLGMKVAAHHYLSSEKRQWMPWAKQFLQHAVYASVRGARERGLSDSTMRRLPVIGRAVDWRSTPWWKQATDHIMVVLTKEK